MRLIKNIFLQSFICLLSYIIPKDKKILLFGAGDGLKFSDNAKYLYLYYIKNTKYKVYWCTKNDAVYQKLRKNNLPVLKVGTFKHFWLLLRAKFLIFGMSISDVSFIGFLPGKFNKIQGWHGTGFKRIALNDKNIIRRYSKFPLALWLIKKEFSSYKFILAISEYDRKRKKEGFLNDNIVITGSPRNDILFNKNLSENNYKNELKLDQYRKIILYAPTFRENYLKKPFSNSYWKKLNNYLKKRNNLFIVKKHPMDKNLEVPKKYKNIKDVSREAEDVQELLLYADLLITDYSSISTDYFLTNKPIIFYIYDYKNYTTKSRNLYYDIKQMLPGPFVHNEKELIELLEDSKWAETKDYKKRYKKFKKIFHKFRDGNSSKRVADIILNYK